MGSLVLAHFEKVVFAGFVSWFIVVGAKPLVAHPDDGAGALDDATATVEAHLTSYVPRVEPYADPGVTVSRELALVAPVDGFPAWCVHRHPNLAFQPVIGPPPPPTPTHSPPTIAIARVGHDEVVLTWKLAPTDEGIDITGDHLLRSVNAGPFVALGRVGPDTTTFTDAAPPSSECTYRVVEHAQAAPRDAPLAADIDRSADSAVAVVPADWVITTSDFGDAAVIAGDPGWANLTVHHWNAKANKFDKHTYQRVIEGHPIGEGAFATGAVLENVAKVGGHLEVKITWPTGQAQVLRAKDPRP